MLTKTGQLLERFAELVGTAIPIAFALALLFFFWGVAQYIRKSGDEKEEGKQVMVWGVVALFVISSIWGIVAFIRGELGVGDVDNQNVPRFGPAGSSNNNNNNNTNPLGGGGLNCDPNADGFGDRTDC